MDFVIKKTKLGEIGLSQRIKKNQGFNKIKLGAQTTAIPFYEHLGFVPEGEEFLDAGIPHRAMSKNIINKEDWF